MRIADEGREFLAKRAEEVGLTRTDCMRLLLRVPVEMLSGAEGPVETSSCSSARRSRVWPT